MMIALIEHFCGKCVDQVSQHKNVITTAACNLLLLVVRLLTIITRTCMYCTMLFSLRYVAFVEYCLLASEISSELA